MLPLALLALSATPDALPLLATREVRLVLDEPALGTSGAPAVGYPEPPPPPAPERPVTYPPPPPLVGVPNRPDLAPSPLSPDSEAARIAADRRERELRFQRQEKSAGLAFVLEFFVPTLGLLYSGAWPLALGEGLALVSGFILVGVGADLVDATPALLVSGAIMIFVARLASWVLSVVATQQTNAELARELGLEPTYGASRLEDARPALEALRF